MALPETGRRARALPVRLGASGGRIEDDSGVRAAVEDQVQNVQTGFRGGLPERSVRGVEPIGKSRLSKGWAMNAQIDADPTAGLRNHDDVVVRCECGEAQTYKVRSYRRAKREGRAAKCASCRKHGGAFVPELTEQQCSILTALVACQRVGFAPRAHELEPIGVRGVVIADQLRRIEAHGLAERDEFCSQRWRPTAQGLARFEGVGNG